MIRQPLDHIPASRDTAQDAQLARIAAALLAMLLIVATAGAVLFWLGMEYAFRLMALA